MTFIGILAAIALPAYQDYISKSQTTRIVGELAAGKTAVDAALFEGKIPALKDAAAAKNTKAKENIGLSSDAQDAVSTSPRSNLLSKVEIKGGFLTGAGTGSITGTVGGNANTDITGIEISQNRDNQGVWTCTINKKTVAGWKDKFAPTGCTVGTGS
ncbi:pilin [Moraxella caprae]|uniref:pilin n=1 Tax=Moraxella caprae TaxID=90240 RepID=UPI000684E2A0|nr:pilin [Moraxella caprae]